jgi:hypothetical protein
VSGANERDPTARPVQPTHLVKVVQQNQKDGGHDEKKSDQAHGKRHVLRLAVVVIIRDSATLDERFAILDGRSKNHQVVW